jgi:AcrR family transcriptional regulator
MTTTTGRSGRRGPYAGTAQRRREIIAAAFEAFSRGGFRGSSLQEIGDAVGMSKPGLLHHFASKEELLQAVLEKREEANQVPAGTQGLDILVHLRETARVDDVTRGTVALFMVTGAEATNPSHPAHEFFVNRYEEVVKLVAAALNEAQIQGDLKQSLDTAEAARLMVGVMDGLLLQMLLNPGMDRLGAFDTYLEQFLAQNAARDYDTLWARVFSNPPRSLRTSTMEAQEPIIALDQTV